MMRSVERTKCGTVPADSPNPGGGLLAWAQANGQRLAALVSLLSSWSRRPAASRTFRYALGQWQRCTGSLSAGETACLPETAAVAPPFSDPSIEPYRRSAPAGPEFVFQTALALLARWPFILHGRAQAGGLQQGIQHPGEGLRPWWHRARQQWPLAFSPTPFDWWLHPALAPDHEALEPWLPTSGEVCLPLPGEGGIPGLESILCLDAVDLLGPLYQWAYPTHVRQRLGEFYTPTSLAAALIDELTPERQGWQLLNRDDAGPDGLILDPACGSGVFLAAACRRMALQLGPDAAARLLRLGLISGIDIQPLAALACRLRLNLLLPGLGRLSPPGPAGTAGCSGWSRVIKSRDALGIRPGPQARRFHFVVGNPPYVRASRIPAGYRARLRLRFETFRAAADLSVAFIQQAVECTLPGGQICLVISDKPLVTRYGVHLRRLLEARCSRWEAAEYRQQEEACLAFEGALVDTLVLRATRRVDDAQDDRGDGHHRGGRREGYTNSAQASPSRVWSLASAGVKSEYGRLLEALEAESLPLEAFGELRGGVMGFHYHKALGLLREHPSVDAPGAMAGVPVVAAGQIRPFHADWNRPVRLLGRQKRRLYLPGETPSENVHGHDPLAGLHQVFTPAMRSFFQAPKLLIKGVAPRLTAAWDPWGLGFLVAVWGFRPRHIDPWLALALLNSPLLDFYARARLLRQRIPRGSWRFPKTLLAHFPLPEATWRSEPCPQASAEGSEGPHDAAQAEAVTHLRRWAQQAHCDPFRPGSPASPDQPARGTRHQRAAALPPTAEQLWRWTGVLYGLDGETIEAIDRARRQLGWT